MDSKRALKKLIGFSVALVVFTCFSSILVYGKYDLPEAIKKMSSRLQKNYNFSDYRANYLATLIYTHSNKHNLDCYYTFSVIEVESSFKQNAISSKGALGLMQIMPMWCGEFRIRKKDLFDSEINISVGTELLRRHIDKYKSPRTALRVYYTGKPRGGDEYVERVINAYRNLVGQLY